ncbi:MAG TPA: hypothetical protein VKS60_24915 [Stellaceae bacterium]|nr:hypothetical protein [Stellaceae bacterium]
MKLDPPATTQPPQSEEWGKLAVSVPLQAGIGLLSLPHTAEHVLNWAKAQGANLRPDSGPHMTGADFDATDPLMAGLPSSQGLTDSVNAGLHILGSPFGRDPSVYQPVTPTGQVAQAAGAAALSGGGGAARAATSALAGGTGDVIQQLTDDPVLSVLGGALSAFLAHNAASAGRSMLPSVAGTNQAAKVVAAVDNSPATALPQPSPGDVSAARSAVQTATGDIGPGLEPWQAGSSLRSDLQGRADQLGQARSDVAGTAYDAFRQRRPLGPDDISPFMARPGFRSALVSAGNAMKDEGLPPITDYVEFSPAGDPVNIKAGMPPDLLDRVKGQLDDAVNATAPGSRAQRTASILRDQFVSLLDTKYPAVAATADQPALAGYADIRQGFADASRPLDPMSYGPVAKTLDATRQYGQPPRYTLQDERVPDTFLKSPATKTDLEQLTAAFGGDRNAALGALEQHLIGRVQGAINPDGTLDQVAFDRAMAPYQKSLNGNVQYWFPGLAQKFATAKAAQGTLDTLTAQKAVSDSIAARDLRDDTGQITPASFNGWLRSNRDLIARSQSPEATMRLQAIGEALNDRSGGNLAETIATTAVPMALGAATGGAEAATKAIAGGMLQPVVQAVKAIPDRMRQAAFTNALERAVTDPAYAAQLADGMARQRGVAPLRALATSALTTLPASTAVQSLPKPASR